MNKYLSIFLIVCTFTHLPHSIATTDDNYRAKLAAGVTHARKIEAAINKKKGSTEESMSREAQKYAANGNVLLDFFEEAQTEIADATNEQQANIAAARRLSLDAVASAQDTSTYLQYLMYRDGEESAANKQATRNHHISSIGGVIFSGLNAAYESSSAAQRAQEELQELTKNQTDYLAQLKAKLTSDQKRTLQDDLIGLAWDPSSKGSVGIAGLNTIAQCCSYAAAQKNPKSPTAQRLSTLAEGTNAAMWQVNVCTTTNNIIIPIALRLASYLIQIDLEKRRQLPSVNGHAMISAAIATDLLHETDIGKVIAKKTGLDRLPQEAQKIAKGVVSYVVVAGGSYLASCAWSALVRSLVIAASLGL